jgi:hypothetical protein
MSVLGVTVVAVALMAGCSSSAQPGSPQPTGGGVETSGSRTSAASSGAPHVANPLDTSKFQAVPCTVLDTSNVQSLGFTAPGQAESDATGPNCHWNNSETGVSLDVGFVTANKSGLSALYAKRSSLKLFQPLPDIQGYPAVIYGTIDARSSGTCNVDVGVSDSLNVDVMLQASTGPLKADPCGTAQKIAGMVMGHLTGGS